MIRRDQPAAAQPSPWLLIPQIAHARLAASVAEVWRFEHLPANDRQVLLAAVLHHDDGWAEWDAAPECDRQSGRPLSFTEMPTAASTAIHRRSIDIAAGFGPLAVYAVAGHFAALLQQYDSWRRAGHEVRAAGESLLAFADQRMDVALAEWLAAAPGRTGEQAELCLRWLQFFDRVSLWLCMAPRTASQRMELPGEGGSITFTPLDERQVRVDPWPLLVPSLGLDVELICLSAAPGDRAALGNVAAGEMLAAPRRTLWWELLPGC